MKQKKTLYTLKPIRTYDTETDLDELIIGEGVTIHIEQCAQVLIHIIRRAYQLDLQCLEGDIPFLFVFPGKGLDEKEEILRR